MRHENSNNTNRTSVPKPQARLRYRVPDAHVELLSERHSGPSRPLELVWCSLPPETPVPETHFLF